MFLSFAYTYSCIMHIWHYIYCGDCIIQLCSSCDSKPLKNDNVRMPMTSMRSNIRMPYLKWIGCLLLSEEGKTCIYSLFGNLIICSHFLSPSLTSQFNAYNSIERKTCKEKRYCQIKRVFGFGLIRLTVEGQESCDL